MNRKTAAVTLLCFAFSIFNLTTPAMAQEDLTQLVKALQKQMSNLQAVVQSQNAELQALKSQQADIKVAPRGVEAAQTPPMSEAEFKQRLTDATGGADKWLKDLKFSGDLRLRYEAFHLNTGNKADTYQPNRNRFRFRLRYGFEKKFTDELKVGFSLASGEKLSANGYNTDPVSTNQSLSNDFNFKNIWIEKAYATYTPDWAKVRLGDDLRGDGFEITAGKFNNPFERGSTDMIWDRDLKPEGVYEKVDAYLLQTDNLKIKAYGILGQFVLKESGNTGTKDSNLFAYQAGLNPIFYVPGLERPVDALSALSVYSYQKYAQVSNWQIDGVSQANGNITSSTPTTSLDARHFNVLSFYQEVAFYPHGIPVRPFVEFAHNMDNKSWLLTGGDNAYSLGLTLGKLQKKGDWQASYQYKWIGANSVPGAFNDSDFGGYNYGGTNKAGSAIKLGYNLTDYLTLNGACFLVSPIAVRSTTANGFQLDEAVRRFQVDLTWKF